MVWGDAPGAQTAPMVNELTGVYLLEEGRALHWLPVGSVRHTFSWGSGFIQCLGYGTGDLFQSSEPVWRHKLLMGLTQKSFPRLRN